MFYKILNARSQQLLNVAKRQASKRSKELVQAISRQRERGGVLAPSDHQRVKIASSSAKLKSNKKNENVNSSNLSDDCTFKCILANPLVKIGHSNSSLTSIPLKVKQEAVLDEPGSPRIRSKRTVRYHKPRVSATFNGQKHERACVEEKFSSVVHLVGSQPNVQQFWQLFGILSLGRCFGSP
ncbi:unnamed protein product [Nesidiocoris tenuis]|uniref:Uncharacterized protein n=1 Tax=Nesidiocoris tenuis TaxID=355587 RepID=A0A6H5G5N4_9HEMI|nr:unnamed protein product [Nesidiocoris tenuis]